MAKDHEGLTVHTMNPVHRKGPVFYSSLPCGPLDTEVRSRLVSTLWNHLAAMEIPLWEHCRSYSGDGSRFQVLRDLLGRPYLMLGEYRGPAISFSESGGNVWAALCGDKSDIGIDVAGTDEFRGEYPFHRVFHLQELQHALMLAGGDLERASALLWSIKEAVVKALGCAFHLVAPRQITVYPPTERLGCDGWYTFPVGLSSEALMRVPIAAGRSLWVCSLPQRKMWLSIVLFNQRTGSS